MLRRYSWMVTCVLGGVFAIRAVSDGAAGAGSDFPPSVTESDSRTLVYVHGLSKAVPTGPRRLQEFEVAAVRFASDQSSSLRIEQSSLRELERRRAACPRGRQCGAICCQTCTCNTAQRERCPGFHSAVGTVGRRPSRRTVSHSRRKGKGRFARSI